MPNTLVFVDFPSADPQAAADFCREVMGWTIVGRPDGVFHQVIPGGEFSRPDGSPSGVENLHLGLYSVSEPRPDPNPVSAPPVSSGPAPRIYIATESRAAQETVLRRAEELGATILWRDRFWRDFGGWHSSFRDPWGTQIILWTETGVDDPDAPAEAS